MFQNSLAALNTDLAALGSILSIVSIMITIVAAVLLIVCAIIGLKRGTIHSLLRFGAVVIAALLAVGLTFALRNVIGTLMQPVMNSLIGDLASSELTEASPTLLKLMNDLPGSLMAPFLFAILFFLLNIILLIVYKIVKKIPIFNKKLIPKKLGKVSIDRMVSAVISVICGLFLIVFFTRPIAGYLSLAEDVVLQFEKVETADKELSEEVAELESNVVTPLAHNPVFVTSGALTGQAIFNSVSSISTESGRIVWEKELVVLFQAYNRMTPLVNSGFDLEHFDKTQADALRGLSEDIGRSVLITQIVSDILPRAASVWNDGGIFFEVESPVKTAPDALRPFMENVFDILEKTTPATLKDNLYTVADVLATLAESGTFSMLSGGASTKELLTALSDGTIAEILDSLNANENMQPLVQEMANLGYEAIRENLALSESGEEVFDEVVEELNAEIAKTESIADYDQKVETLSDSITDILAKHGASATEEEIALYAQCLVGTGPITVGGSKK